MKTKFLFYSNILAIFIALFLWGCKGKKGEETSDEVEVEILEQATDEEFPIVLPSPLRIAAILKDAGLTYFSDATNSKDNITSYHTKLSKSLNFGIYTADLAYCVLNNQSQEALNYIKVVKQLSEELGMANAFDTEKTFDNFEKNIGNIDSLFYIIASIQDQMDVYLDDNNEEYMSAVYFTGAWLEGMYFGSKVIQYQENEKLSKRLVEQMSILDNLLKGLDYYPNKDGEFNNLISDLKSIKNIYDNFETIKNLPPDEEISYEDIVISKEEMNNISKKIDEVRNRIIRG